MLDDAYKITIAANQLTATVLSLDLFMKVDKDILQLPKKQLIYKSNVFIIINVKFFKKYLFKMFYYDNIVRPQYTIA